LTQLTRLKVVGETEAADGLPCSAIRPTLRLPCLQHLHLVFDTSGPASVRPLLHSEELTFLILEGGHAASVRISLTCLDLVLNRSVINTRFVGSYPGSLDCMPEDCLHGCHCDTLESTHSMPLKTKHPKYSVPPVKRYPSVADKYSRLGDNALFYLISD